MIIFHSSSSSRLHTYFYPNSGLNKTSEQLYIRYSAIKSIPFSFAYSSAYEPGLPFIDKS